MILCETPCGKRLFPERLDLGSLAATHLRGYLRRLRLNNLILGNPVEFEAILKTKGFEHRDVSKIHSSPPC